MAALRCGGVWRDVAVWFSAKALLEASLAFISVDVSSRSRHCTPFSPPLPTAQMECVWPAVFSVSACVCVCVCVCVRVCVSVWRVRW